MLETIYRQLGAISVGDAVSILTELGCADEIVLIALPLGNRSSTVWNLLNEWGYEFPAADAGLISFRGGPQKAWLSGTLLTLVVDKFLWLIRDNNVTQFYYSRWSEKGTLTVKVNI